MVKFKNDFVSPFCLGCLNFGTKTDEKTSFEIMDKFIAEGGNFFDTANNYAFWNEGAQGGESEKVLGKWIKERKNRDDIFLATKGGAMPKNLGSGFDEIEGLSKKAIIKAVDESLLRLNTDYIDLYYVHIFDEKVSQQETLEALDLLIKQGKIKNIGCSNFTYDNFKEALSISEANNLAKYCCIQNRYSYLTPNKDADFGVQRYFNREYLDKVKDLEDIKLFGYSPLLNGYYYKKNNLSKKYINDDVADKMEELEKVASKLNVLPGEVVLAWMIQNNPSVIPLIAVSSIEQLNLNLKALEIKLSKEDILKLNK